MFQCERPPTLYPHDLPDVVRLLGIFDRLSFNGFGEMIVQADETLPVFGKVTISLFVREDHYKIFRQNGRAGTDDDFLNTTHNEPINSREELVNWAKAALKEAAATV